MLTRFSFIAGSSCTVLALASLWLWDHGREAAQGDAALPPILAAPGQPAAELEALNLCDLLSASDVESLVGKLERPPQRVAGVEHGEPDPGGSGCTFSFRDPSGRPAAITVDLEICDHVDEVAGGMIGDLFQKELHGPGAKAAPPERHAGWDYFAESFTHLTARVGHLTLRLKANGAVTDAQVEALAAALRDRIPDRPFGTIAKDATSGDPCALFDRAAIEAALCPLVIPPYRSQDNSVADPDGRDCSFFCGGHRVLVLLPDLDDGKTLFKMAANFGQLLPATIGVAEASADGLEGPWDQAASCLGKLYFLKGDHALEMDYLSAGVDLEIALRVAAAALRKL